MSEPKLINIFPQTRTKANFIKSLSRETIHINPISPYFCSLHKAAETRHFCSFMKNCSVSLIKHLSLSSASAPDGIGTEPCNLFPREGTLRRLADNKHSHLMSSFSIQGAAKKLETSLLPSAMGPEKHETGNPLRIIGKGIECEYEF